MNRALSIISLLTEAYYSTNTTPQIRDYQDLIYQTADLLYHNTHDTRPIQLIYTYLVSTESEKLNDFLQELGHHLVTRYGLRFEDVEQLLNMVVRRLAAVGHMRSMQRASRSRSMLALVRR